jgi:hypothetical protein
MASAPDDAAEIRKLRVMVTDEAGMMKLESFGDQLLHIIGEFLENRSEAYLNAWRVYSDFTGYFSDRWQMLRDSYAIANSGLEAKSAIDSRETAHRDVVSDGCERENEDLSAEDQRYLTGKILAACWQTTVKEVHDVLR